MCQSFFSKVMGPLQNVLEESKIDRSNVDDIVMVGGSTRIPMIQQMVSNFFNKKELNKSLNPDEAVAYGATTQAAILNGDNNLDLTLVDVIPISLGTSIASGEFVKFIKRNSKIPAQETLFSEPQLAEAPGFMIRVYEGERALADQNRYLGKVVLDPPKGKIVQYAITLEVDTNGVLAVSAKDQATGDISHEVFERCARVVPQDVLSSLKEEAKAYQEADELEIKRLEARNKLLMTCVNIKYNLFNDESLSSLSKAAKDEIEMRCQEAEDWAKKHPDEKSETYQRKKDEVTKDWNILSVKPNLGNEGV